MKKNQERRNVDTSSLLCLNIVDGLEKIISDSRKCDIYYVGDLKFEIDCTCKSFEVDLQQRTCGCRKWELICRLIHWVYIFGY